MPWPKARCWLSAAGRGRSASGVGEALPGRGWPTAGTTTHRSPGRDGDPAELDRSSVATRTMAVCTGLVVAQELLDRRGEQPGRRAAARSWSGWLSSASTPLPMRLTVVSCPATSSRNGHRGQLVLGQPVALVRGRDQRAEQVVSPGRRRGARRPARPGTSRPCAAGSARSGTSGRQRCSSDLRRRRRTSSRKLCPVGGRHAEQLADDCTGSGKANAATGRRVAAGHAVEQVVGDLLRSRAAAPRPGAR